MKKPCSEMFCLRHQDITDAKAFFIYFLCRTQLSLKYANRNDIKPIRLKVKIASVLASFKYSIREFSITS